MTVATVIRTGRSRRIPASSRASRNGAPFMRLLNEIKEDDDVAHQPPPPGSRSPRESHEPEGDPMIQSAANAPTMPKGIAANTIMGLIACLN